jgi:hypothetical protein
MLAQGSEIIYIGRAQGGTTTIRSRLKDHFSGREGVCTKKPTHYCSEVIPNPVAREKELLEWFKKKYGKLPRCNQRVG